MWLEDKTVWLQIALNWYWGLIKCPNKYCANSEIISFTYFSDNRQRMHEQTNERTNEQMNEQMNE